MVSAGNVCAGCGKAKRRKATHDLLFHPNNPNTAGLAAHYCVEAIEKWEPRVSEVEATAEPSAEEPNTLYIRISYKLTRTGALASLTFPFDLQKDTAE